MQALYFYTEKYLEAQGVHNLLYAFVTLAGDFSGYPGNQYVDFTGWDNYNNYGGGPYLDPRYSSAITAGGGNNKPMVWAEEGYDGNWGNIISAMEGGVMPNIVLINVWSIGPLNYPLGAWPNWPAALENPYSILPPDVTQ
jgi:hypothetical protein